MATLRNIIDDCRVFVEDATGRPSSDTVIPRKVMYHLINQEYGRIIAKYNKSEFNFPEEIVESLPCVEMEVVDKAEDCPCAPATGCLWMRSKEPLPDMMFDLPIMVSSVDGGDEYDYIRWNYAKYRLGSRVKASRRGKYYSVKNIGGRPYLYLHNSRLENVAVDLIADDVLDVLYYPMCGNVKEFCSPLEEEISIPQDILSEVYEGVHRLIQNGKALGGAGDILNNDRDDTVPSRGEQAS